LNETAIRFQQTLFVVRQLKRFATLNHGFGMFSYDVFSLLFHGLELAHKAIG